MTYLRPQGPLVQLYCINCKRCFRGTDKLDHTVRRIQKCEILFNPLLACRSLDMTKSTKAPYNFLLGTQASSFLYAFIDCACVNSVDVLFISPFSQKQHGSYTKWVEHEDACAMSYYLACLAEDTCELQCGVNTWCSGDWLSPSSFACSCFDGFLPPTQDSRNCYGSLSIHA